MQAIVRQFPLSQAVFAAQVFPGHVRSRQRPSAQTLPLPQSGIPRQVVGVHFAVEHTSPGAQVTAPQALG